MAHGRRTRLGLAARCWFGLAFGTVAVGCMNTEKDRPIPPPIGKTAPAGATTPPGQPAARVNQPMNTPIGGSPMGGNPVGGSPVGMRPAGGVNPNTGPNPGFGGSIGTPTVPGVVNPPTAPYGGGAGNPIVPAVGPNPYPAGGSPGASGSMPPPNYGSQAAPAGGVNPVASGYASAAGVPGARRPADPPVSPMTDLGPIPPAAPSGGLAPAVGPTQPVTAPVPPGPVAPPSPIAPNR